MRELDEKPGAALAGCLLTVLMFSVTAAIIMLLAGCAEFGSVKAGVASHGAKTADEALDVAVWDICHAQTVGAWMRRYGTDKSKSEAWRILCGYPATP